MNISIGVFSKAILEASKSKCHHRIGAVIFKGKRIISTGRNYSLKSAHNLHPSFQKYPGSVHAEMDAILKAKRPLKGMSIFVVRLSVNNNVRLARPCIWCEEYLRRVGIKKAYFTSNNEKIEEMMI